MNAAVPLINILNELSDVNDGETLDASLVGRLTSYAADLLQVISHECRRIDTDRKSTIINDLHNDLRALKHTDEPDATFLFGEDTDLTNKILALKKQKVEVGKPQRFYRKPFQAQQSATQPTKNLKVPHKSRWKKKSAPSSK